MEKYATFKSLLMLIALIGSFGYFFKKLARYIVIRYRHKNMTTVVVFFNFDWTIS